MMLKTLTKKAFTTAEPKIRKPAVRTLYDYQDIYIVPNSCRSVKKAMIGYKDVSAGRALRTPLTFMSNQISWTMQENFLIRSLHHYAMDWESPFSKHVYDTEVTSVRLNMVYLHMWLLKFHLGKPNKDENFIKAECKDSHHNLDRTKIDQCNIKHLQQRLIEKEHVKVYTNTFDDAIHEELKRSNRVIDHALSALFLHSPNSLNNERRLVSRLDDDDLEELILYNILNEEPEARREQIKRISDYIRISVHEEDSYSFSTRMESYYYSTSVDTLFQEQAEGLQREGFRQGKPEVN